MMNNILIAVSEFNPQITRNLAHGAQQTLQKHGIPPERIDLVWVPGAFELPLICARAAKYGRYQGIIALGCVIRGETPHFDYICQETARGIMEVGLKAELPIAFGVLTTNTMAEALARSRLATPVALANTAITASDEKQVGENKGSEAALAVLRMMELMQSHPGRWNKGTER